MDSEASIRAKLNACRYIFLSKLETGPSLDLRIEVVEARSQEERVRVDTGNKELDAAFGELHPITAKEGYDAFRIVFQNYICFSVRNESYATPEDDEDYSLRLRRYQRSTFMDFVEKGTWAEAVPDHPGAFAHYAVVCEDHVIDVACSAEPIIQHRLVTADDL